VIITGAVATGKMVKEVPGSKIFRFCCSFLAAAALELT